MQNKNKIKTIETIINFVKKFSANENFGCLLLAAGFQLFSLKTTAEGATALFVGSAGFGWFAALLIQICLLFSSHLIVQIIARQYGARKPNFVAPALIFLVSVSASIVFSAIGFYDYNGRSVENSTISLNETSVKAQQKIGELENYQQRFAQEISARASALNKQVQSKQSQLAAAQTNKRARYASELANLRRKAQMLENALNELNEIVAARIFNEAAGRENAVASDVANAVFDVRKKVVDVSEQVAFDAELKKYVETNPVPPFSPSVNQPTNLKAAFWRDLSAQRASAVSALAFGGVIDLLSILCVFAALPFGVWRAFTFAVVDAVRAIKNSVGDLRRAFARPPANFSTLRCIVVGVDDCDVEFKMNFEQPDAAVTVADLEVLRRNIVEKLEEETGARVAINFKTQIGVELDPALPLFEQLNGKPLYAEMEQWSEIIGDNHI